MYIVTDSLEGLHKQYTSRVVYGNLNVLYGRKMKYNPLLIWMSTHLVANSGI